MDTPYLGDDDLATRHAEFQQWVREVRDPADIAREGIRLIEVRDAAAEYEVAPLPDGRWAIRFGLAYQCGDDRGHHRPWNVYDSRELCVAAFLEAARRHFGAKLTGVADGVSAQLTAQTAMLQLLRNDGLFGFIEPEVDSEES